MSKMHNWLRSAASIPECLLEFWRLTIEKKLKIYNLQTDQRVDIVNVAEKIVRLIYLLKQKQLLRCKVLQME